MKHTSKYILAVIAVATGIGLLFTVGAAQGGLLSYFSSKNAPSLIRITEVDKIEVLRNPKKVPMIQFFDESENLISLSKFSDKLQIINFWATWCSTCVAEMPHLVKAQELLGDEAVIIPLSLDVRGINKVKRFYEQNNITNLDIYLDNRQKSFQAFNMVGVPATVIISPDGYEIARAKGFVNWSDPDVIRYIQSMY